MPVTFDHRVTIAPEVLFRLLSDDAVVVNLNTEQYLELNAVGARMWTVLSDATSIQAAFERLTREFDVDPAQLRDDLAAFVDELHAHRLIAIGPG